MITKDTKKLEVTVNRVLLPKEPFTDGRERFTLLLTNEGKCAGMMAFYPKPGTRLVLTGNAETYHGELNFKFKKVEHNAPVDKHALLIYAATLSKGVGEKAVEKIWAAYGADWDKHLDEMSPTWCNALARTLNELHANEDRLRIVSYMVSIGGTPKMADVAFAKWGTNAIATIENDPYVLASLPGIGFKTVDERIRRHFGIGDGDIRRALAAIDYSVTARMDESGDTVLSRDALYDAVSELNIPQRAASYAIAKLVASKRIVYIGIDKITTSTVVRYESDFARYAALYERMSEDFVECVNVHSDIELDDSQMRAVRTSVANRGLTIINGGAGAGKTTIIKAIAETLDMNGCDVKLCAFAGKAAARLREATGMSASTIHSMLGWTGEGRGFSTKNLHGCTVVLDEASMVPSSLMYELTRRDPERLILVGDQAQLQPVGIGSPFHDAIDCLPSLVNTLTTCYRNKEAVFAAALKIRNGEVPSSSTSAEEIFDVRRYKDAKAIHEYIIQLVNDGTIDFDKDLVLSPRNGEGDEPAPATVNALNKDIQAIANPHGSGEKIKIGDRVMCVKNCSRLDIWNGTTGWITAMDIDGKPWMTPDGCNPVRLAEEDVVRSIVPAYCLTVHKAQGSQYRNVYIVCTHRDEFALLDRSMLYTAVTRAKHGCFLLCDEGLRGIVENVRRRTTYLSLLLNGEI